ncbi:MAG: ABC transporter substrate-binding protein, partial [Acetobacteraceae bacterium]
VVLLSPSDFPAIGPLCLVTADLMKKIGFNVDLQQMDWGTGGCNGRSSMEPVEKGGWSVFHTYGSSGAYSSPATSTLVRGQGKAGWFGWWESAKAEELTQDWLAAPDAGVAEARRRRIVAAGDERGGDGAARHQLQQDGVPLQGVAPYPWNVRPA